MWSALVLTAVNIVCYLRYPRLIYRYWRRTGRFPYPACPRTLPEKYLWRKIFDHNPLFVEMSDKIRAKDHARRLDPEIAAARILWTGSDAADIPAEILAGDVVVKTNHGSGQNILVSAGQADRTGIEARTKKWLARPYGRRKGEWAYRHIGRKLFVEEMIGGQGQPVACEYKCYVGSGRVAYVYLKRRNAIGSILDRDGESYVVAGEEGSSTVATRMPTAYPAIIRHAEKLGREIDYARIDLYEHRGQVYFSEFTLYSKAGFGWIDHPRLMADRNRLWDIRSSWFMRQPWTGWRAVYVEALRLRVGGPANAQQEASGH
jgi:hypothetical protein